MSLTHNAYFMFAFFCYNTIHIKFAIFPFSVYNSVQTFSALPILGNHHHCLVSEHFHHAKRKPHAHSWIWVRHEPCDQIPQYTRVLLLVKARIVNGRLPAVSAVTSVLILN